MLPIAERRGDDDDAARCPACDVDGVNAQVFTNGTLAYVVTERAGAGRLCTRAGGAGRHPRPGVDLRAAPAPSRCRSSTCRTAARSCAARFSCRSTRGGWYGAGAGAAATGTTGTTAPRSCRSAATRSPSVAGSRVYVPPNGYIRRREQLARSSSTSRTPTRRRSRRSAITDDPSGWWGEHAGRRRHALHDALRVGRPDRRTSTGSSLDRALLRSTASTSPTARTPAGRVQDQRPGPARRRLARPIRASSTPSTTAGTRQRRAERLRRRAASTATSRYLPSTTHARRLGRQTSSCGRRRPISRRRSTPGPRRRGPSLDVELHADRPLEPDARRSTASRRSAKRVGLAARRQGDRAVVTSGWGPDGVDIYQLSTTAAPGYDQFVRTLGWWATRSRARGTTLFLVERLLGRAGGHAAVTLQMTIATLLTMA